MGQQLRDFVRNDGVHYLGRMDAVPEQVVVRVLAEKRRNARGDARRIDLAQAEVGPVSVYGRDFVVGVEALDLDSIEGSLETFKQRFEVGVVQHSSHEVDGCGRARKEGIRHAYGGCHPYLTRIPNEKISRPHPVQLFYVSLDGAERASNDARVLRNGDIADVVASDLDYIKRTGRRRTAEVLQEAVHLMRQVDLAAVVTGPSRADCIIGRACARSAERRLCVRGKALRLRELLDPGGPVGEVVAAARVWLIGNEEEIHRVVGGRVRPAYQCEGIAGIGQAISEHHDAYGRPLCQSQRWSAQRAAQQADEQALLCRF